MGKRGPSDEHAFQPSAWNGDPHVHPHPRRSAAFDEAPDLNPQFPKAKALPLIANVDFQTQPVPPDTHRIMATLDPALQQTFFDTAKAHWKADILPLHKSNDFECRVEAFERAMRPEVPGLRPANDSLTIAEQIFISLRTHARRLGNE